ncbi:hypothetical protein M405DRAFT_20703 [Rhizopogon salebrosus TDB-379]|nr:hypothetical protein M405DRAFT_20703 [Rhizopogon salebrosus TDB-379]
MEDSLFLVTSNFTIHMILFALTTSINMQITTPLKLLSNLDSTLFEFHSISYNVWT